MKREFFSSGSPYEKTVGYSRSVKIGPHIYISGTGSFSEEGKIVGLGDAYAQTKRILTIIETTLKQAGASLEDVVRTRMYLTNANDIDKVCQAHGETFSKIRPASCLVIVQGLILPEMLVEIECDALINNP